MKVSKRDNINLAPIVLFVYNRPVHTEKTLSFLSKNYYAEDSHLYIYSDGPKNILDNEEVSKINEVRRVIRLKKWCGTVNIFESTTNKGLGKSIVEGVTEILKKYDRVIVLEDDIVTSKYFLKYMNEALELYKDDDKVMHISGYIYPVRGKLPETFFLNLATCWGWGTWSRAWEKLRVNPEELLDEIVRKNEVNRFNLDGSYDFSIQLKQNIEGTINTWAIKWYSTIFLNDGLSLHPRRSFTNNIGFDGTGINCGIENGYNWKMLSRHLNLAKMPLEELQNAREMLKSFFYSKLGKEAHYKKYSKILIKKSKYFIKLLLNLLNKFLFFINLRIEVIKIRKEEELVKKMPRYTSFEIVFLDKKIKIVDSVSFLSMKRDIYDREMYKFKSKNQTPVIIDCGSNIGLSIIYFKNLYPNSCIIGFEPDKMIFEILNYNLSQFKYSNIKLINKAVWNKECKTKFFSEKADEGRIIEDNSGYSNIEDVEKIRLRDFLNDKIDFLKIDIEGAEMEVLEDCKDLLKNVGNLFLKYHSSKNKVQNLDRILEIIKMAGFKYYLGDSSLYSQYPFLQINTFNGFDNQINIFAVRNDN